MFKKLYMFILIVTMSSTLMADNLHYKGHLVGSRAAGMGGAFTAISDDPSGSYYNPAGMAFSTQSYISLSTNTYQRSTAEFKDIFTQTQGNNKNWYRKTQTLVPSFFGILQQFGSYMTAFSVINPYSETVNQDTSLILSYDDEIDNRTFLYNKDETTNMYFAGPSMATLVTDSFAIGASLFAVIYEKEKIDSQYASWINQNKFFWQSQYVDESAKGVMGVLGGQWMVSEKWSFGTSVKAGRTLSATSEQQLVVASRNNTTHQQESNDLLKKWDFRLVPLSLHSGLAYFASPYLLLSADVSYYPEYDAVFDFYDRGSVINWSAGLEYYVTLNIPFRFGMYSNQSILKRVQVGDYDIDLYGITGAIGYETEVSALTLGADYSFGSGVIGWSDGNHDAHYTDISLFFSGTYKL